MENTYQRGKIYQICSPHTAQIYIGSTTEKTLANRLAKHRAKYQKWKAGNKKFVTSFILLDQPKYFIRLIEAYPCNSKDELLAREQYYIDIHTNVCVNKNKAFYAGNVQAYNKEYNNNNSHCLTKPSTQRANITRHTLTFDLIRKLKELFGEEDWTNTTVARCSLSYVRVEGSGKLLLEVATMSCLFF
jgi:hypothetical protein